MQKNYSLRSPSNNSNRHNVRKSGKAFHPLCRTLHQNVTVKVTDVNGDAKLNIRLMAGEYIITSMYNGYATSNKVTVKA